MVNSKRKGSDFERHVAKRLNELIKKGEFKRIAGSGSIGTQLGIPLLMGDIYGEVKGFPKKIKIEAKVGYGGSTMMSVKKEWLDKIQEEADFSYSTPFIVGRFSNSRSGVQEFVVMDIEIFAYLMNYITELYEEIENGLRK